MKYSGYETEHHQFDLIFYHIAVWHVKNWLNFDQDFVN